MKQGNFNDYRFGGFDYGDYSNKYYKIKNHVSENEEKIIVCIGENHLVKTRFGYALILDNMHVIFLKSWQVSTSPQGNYVLLDKKFWNVKEWGNFENFMVDENELKFETWLEAAKEQTDEIMWSKIDHFMWE